MSAAGINGNNYNSTVHTSTTTANNHKTNGNRITGDDQYPRRTTHGDGSDSVELSDEARELAKANAATDSARTERRQAIRERLERLSASRADLDSHIKAILKKNGLKPADSQKLRLEVDSNGKIVAGGLNDKEALRAIEEALNREQGLGKQIKEFQRESKALSGDLQRETGMTMEQLVKDMKGGKDDWSKKVHMFYTGSVQDDAYFSQLQHVDLFREDPELLGMMQDLAADTGIDISGDDRTLSEPERVLKNTLTDTWKKIGEAVDEYNKNVMAKMSGDSAMQEPDFAEKYLISLRGAGITVDSNGGIVIEGEFATDARTAADARKILESFAQEMLEITSEDGEINLFKDATERLLDMYKETFKEDAAGDAVVLASVGSSAMTGEVRLSSPSKEAEIKEEAAAKVNALLADMDIETPEPVEIEIDEKGRIRAVNLGDDEMANKIINAAIESINSGVEAADETDKRYGKLKTLLKHHMAFQPGGLHEALQQQPQQNAATTVTDYVVAPIDRSGFDMPSGTSTLDLENINYEMNRYMPESGVAGQDRSEKEYAASFAGYDNSQAVADFLASFKGAAPLDKIDGTAGENTAGATEQGGDFTNAPFDTAVDAWLRGEGVFTIGMFGATTADGFRVLATGKSQELLAGVRDAMRADDYDTLNRIQKELATLKPSDLAFLDMTGLGNLGLGERNDFLDKADELFAKAGLDVSARSLNFSFNKDGEVDFARDDKNATLTDTQIAIQNILNKGVDGSDADTMKTMRYYGQYAYSEKLVLLDTSRTIWA